MSNNQNTSDLSLEQEYGILPPLATQMNVDLVITQGDSAILILHDKPLPEILKWIEYDYETNDMVLVTQSGQIQNIGLTVTKKMREFIEGADKAVAIYLNGNKAKDMAYVPLIIQGITVN